MSSKLRVLKYIGTDSHRFPYDRYIVLGEHSGDEELVKVLLLSPHEDDDPSDDDNKMPEVVKYGLVVLTTSIRKQHIGKFYVEDPEWPNPSE